MPICPTCQESFASRKEYSSHAKKCVQEATISLPHINQTINLKRDEEGNFICHCSAMGCPKPFKYANSMRTHIIKAGSRWKGQGNPSIGKLDLVSNFINQKNKRPVAYLPITDPWTRNCSWTQEELGKWLAQAE
ncbi:hypothetical protein BKA82DRAFT_36658 [Pisolithus tinctorius]|uniref:Uncharacterized protein n=1 Tax=Pisolithus tinctorius Marx 270 TaxID=870435 RepID=A0A0C3MVC1_PISTI|nr:hypothetical protein BKA82DRAFT_36658 [Pisolithus tinctorius]KIN92859.1 hypothetical protein M404DRAFT_36658 [Pisolithus tinctorius Marx 270]